MGSGPAASSAGLQLPPVSAAVAARRERLCLRGAERRLWSRFPESRGAELKRYSCLYLKIARKGLYSRGGAPTARQRLRDSVCALLIAAAAANIPVAAQSHSWKHRRKETFVRKELCMRLMTDWR